MCYYFYVTVAFLQRKRQALSWIGHMHEFGLLLLMYINILKYRDIYLSYTSHADFIR